MAVRLFLYLLPVLVSHSLHGVVPSILIGCSSGLTLCLFPKAPVTYTVPGLAV